MCACPVPCPPHRFARADLAAVPLFGGLDDAGWARLLEVARRGAPREGEAVQVAGQPASGLVVVLSGGLRMVHSEMGGQSRVVRLLGPGDHVGETEFVLGRLPVHSAFALPRTATCVIGQGDFAVLARDHPALVRALLTAAHRRLLATELLLSSESADDVLTRLVGYLLALPGKATDDGRRRMLLPSSQADVASFLGTTPESLSRRLTDLEDSGALSRMGRGAFLLDVVALRGLLSDRGA